MKFALIILSVFLLTMVAGAATVKMAWKQSEIDLPSMDRWNIYWGLDTTTPNLLTTIPYTGQTKFEISAPIPSPAGTPGQKVKYYFSIEPISKNGNIAERTLGKTAAGLDYIEMVVPYQDVGKAFEVIIELTTEKSKASTQVKEVLKGMPK
jgi:hypothetical protein